MAACRSEAGPRDPRQTTLYRVVERHLDAFLAHADEAGGLPRFVAHELRSFLRCGVLEFGFARFRCHACRQDRLVAFSCKKRGVCPSCGGRRMADLAAWLCDRVLPAVPIRQWVVSLPYDVRALLAYDPEVCRAVRTVFVRAVSSWIERRARDAGHPGGRTGAVVFVQRFDSALQLNVHFHALVLDGVFCREAPLAAPEFRRIPPPTDDDIARLTKSLAARIARCLTKLARDPGDLEPSPLTVAYAAAVQGTLPFADRPGTRAPRLGEAEVSRPRSRSPLSASYRGVSLQAATTVGSRDRADRERLCRYAARPAIADDRLSVTADGHVLVRFKRPHRDGRTHVRLDPLSFLSRLAALIPRPRTHLVTYHGALAPAASLRSDIVPDPPDDGDDDLDLDLLPRHGLRTRRHHRPRPTQRRRLLWAELLLRVFHRDALACSCGGRLYLVALIQQLDVAAKILGHLGLLEPARAPPRCTSPA